MLKQAYQEHQDEDVLAATPLNFVVLLYRGALDAIGSARRYLRLGDIRARSRAITKAMLIVTELSLSLNHNEGGELSRNLAELYAYIETLLIKANFEQCDPPLAEAEGLLGTLAEAWKTCPQPASTASVLESRQAVVAMPASAYSSR
jgi:flagellar protein FliS